jgi:class 3 adenylate cyclase
MASKNKNKSSKPSMQSEKTIKDKLMNERLDTLAFALKFRQFLNCSFEPTISDSEIIVCFADVRGFTDYCKTLQQEMQDRKIQNFLRTYIKIFNEGLMMWHTKHFDAAYSQINNDLIDIAAHVIPRMYKNLGDGLMIVWEIPSDLDLAAQGRLTQQIILVVDEIIKRFYHHFTNLLPVELDSYSKAVEKLDLGCGVAKGHAWRLDYGHSVDYAGSVINLASRLEGRARPSGMVAHYDVSPWLFNQATAGNNGHIVEVVDLKGYGNVRAWVDSNVDFKQKGFVVSKIK